MRPEKDALSILDLLVFQYRKRYEVTCDVNPWASEPLTPTFQYRKRYEVTCDMEKSI